MSKTLAPALVFASALALAAIAGENRNFSVHLSGDNEVPPRETAAQGQAILQVSKDGLSVEYKLIASNIENVNAAHIHLGTAGVNGPVIVGLYSAAPGGGRTDGVAPTNTGPGDFPGGEIRGQI